MKTGLDLLFTLELVADESESAAPYGTAEGRAIERGHGLVSGEGLRGTVRYSRKALTNADGSAAIALDGLITATDGALVAFEGAGRVGANSRGLLVITLLAHSELYQWLNPLVCLGAWDGAGGLIAVSAYL